MIEYRADLQDSENYNLARQAFARYGKTKRREDYMEYIRLRDSLPQRFRILFVELQRPVRKDPA